MDDTFQIIRARESGKAMYVGHIAGTMSAFDRRPSARVLNVDTSTNMPVTIDVYSTSNL
jgi:hypothetical protein